MCVRMSIQQAKVKAATEVLDLQRENRQLKRELDSKLNLQSQSPLRQSPHQTPTGSRGRGPTEAGPRASGGSSSRGMPNREENGGARTGSGQWDDNFFSNIFGSQPGAKGASRPGSLDDENWDDSYFMELLGTCLLCVRMLFIKDLGLPLDLGCCLLAIPVSGPFFALAPFVPLPACVRVERHHLSRSLREGSFTQQGVGHLT